MKNSEYIKQFNEKYVIDIFREMIKADAPSSATFVDRDVDIIDVETFFDKYCVAIGYDGMADLIVNEYYKRAENLGCIIDATAEEMALAELKENFLYAGYSGFESNSSFASAIDWLEDNYTPLRITVDFNQLMIVVFNFKNSKFDPFDYTDPNWDSWDGEVTHIIKIANEKITY